MSEKSSNFASSNKKNTNNLKIDIMKTFTIKLVNLKDVEELANFFFAIEGESFKDFVENHVTTYLYNTKEQPLYMTLESKLSKHDEISEMLSITKGINYYIVNYDNYNE